MRTEPTPSELNRPPLRTEPHTPSELWLPLHATVGSARCALRGLCALRAALTLRAARCVDSCALRAALTLRAAAGSARYGWLCALRLALRAAVGWFKQFWSTSCPAFARAAVFAVQHAQHGMQCTLRLTVLRHAQQKARTTRPSQVLDKQMVQGMRRIACECAYSAKGVRARAGLTFRTSCRHLDFLCLCEAQLCGVGEKPAQRSMQCALRFDQAR